MYKIAICDIPCRLARMAGRLFIFVCFALLDQILVQGQEQNHVQPGPPDFCIKNDFHVKDQYHKDAPSPETNALQTCQSWQNLSCCTNTLTVTLSSLNNSQGIYNFTYDLCGTLSPNCAKFMRVSSIPVKPVIVKTFIYGTSLPIMSKCND